MAEEIKVIVGADTRQLTSELDKANKSIEKFGSTVKTGANKASLALTDISRIAQDLPYGFVGISNNLNPLVESFGRLKRETGSGKEAIYSMIAALSGPAGIGLAFGIVSSAISFASVGLSRWIQTTKEGKKEVNELEKAQQEFVKSLDSAKSSALSTGLQLQAYVDIARNGKLPLEQRNEALKKANEILGEHGTKLTLVNINTAKATEEVNKFTEALIAQSIATKYSDRIADLTIQKTKILRDLNAAISDETKKRLNVEKTYADFKKQFNTGEETDLGVLRKATSDLTAAQNKTKTLSAQLTQVESDRSKTLKELNLTTEEATKLFGSLGYESKKDAKKIGESIDEIIAKFRLKLTADEAKFLPPLEEIRAKISDYESVIEKLIVEKKVKLTFPKLIEIQNELAKLRELEKQIEEQSKGIKLKLKIAPIGPGLLESDKEIMKLYEALGKFKRDIKAEEFKLLPSEQVIKNQISAYRAFIETAIKDFKLSENSSLVQSLQEELAALLGKSTQNLTIDITKTLQDELQTGAYEAGILFGESLANGLASGDISSFFEGINTILADGMIRIGKQFIKFASELIIIQKTLISNPYTALIAGIALVAVGTAMKNQMAKQKAFATGTTFAPGGMALVGERGPELVSLPQGSKVIPNGKTNSMMQGAMQAVEVYGTLRGQDIYFSNKKYGLTYNRQT